MCLLIISKQTVHYLYIKKVILVQSLALWYKQCVQKKIAETHLRGYTVVLIDIGTQIKIQEPCNKNENFALPI